MNSYTLLCIAHNGAKSAKNCEESFHFRQLQPSLQTRTYVSLIFRNAKAHIFSRIQP